MKRMNPADDFTLLTEATDEEIAHELQRRSRCGPDEDGTPLCLACDDQIWAELGRRYRGLVASVLHFPPRRDEYSEPTQIMWRGCGFLMAYGLAQRAVVKMTQLAMAAPDDSSFGATC